MRLLYGIPFLLLFSLCSCKMNDQRNVGNIHDLIPPLIVRTTLYDSLPPSSMQHFQLKNIEGIKVKYATGQYVSYFEYDADRDTVLNAIANLPFSKYSKLADTTCRKVSGESIQQRRSFVSGVEQSTGLSFWEATEPGAEVYECLKAPFRHTVIISKKSPRILHRIAYEG